MGSSLNISRGMAVASAAMLFRGRRAAGDELVDQYTRRFAQAVLGDESIPCMAFWRGRVALWTILRAAGVGEGDEVVLPAYTCEMVPAAVKFTGAKCVYADVQVSRASRPRVARASCPHECVAADDVTTSDFAPSVESLLTCVTPRTKAILVQHTYGIIGPVGQLRAKLGRQALMERSGSEPDLSDSASPRIIEDCCQAVLNGHACRGGDASFFSMQWNKPFTTGLGGVAAFNNAELARRAALIADTFDRSGDRSRARSLAMQSLVYWLTVRPATRGLISRLYRWAQAMRLVKGTTTAQEYGDAMPADYLARGLNIQARLGLKQLDRWPANVAHRGTLTRLYLDGLAKMNAASARLAEAAGDQPLWVVPLLVENKPELLELATRHRLPLATWFGRPPMHVAPESANRYDFSPGQCPRSEAMFMREVHLLTAPGVTTDKAEAALAMLRRHARFGPE